MKTVLSIYAAWFLVVLAGCVGWVWNIVKLINSDFSAMSGMLVARILGVPIPPLGAVLGYF